MKNLEYKVEIVKESGLGLVFLKASNLPTTKMVEVMNQAGAEGWQVVFQVIEKRRFLLFWAMESVIITFCREK